MGNPNDLLWVILSGFFGKNNLIGNLLERRKSYASIPQFDLNDIYGQIQEIQKNNYLLNQHFPDSIENDIMQILDHLSSIKNQRRVELSDVLFMPNNQYERMQLKEAIESAFYVNIDNFFSFFNRGLLHLFPNINLQNDYAMYYCKNNQELLDLFLDKKIAKNIINGDKSIISQLELFSKKSIELIHHGNYLVYLKQSPTNLPLDGAILRLKDFPESIPQKIARYWIDLLKKYEPNKKVNDLFFEELTLEDLLLTDVFGIALLINNKKLGSKTDISSFYRPELVDARKVSLRTIEKDGFDRRISKLFDPKTGIFVDFHTTDLSNFLKAEFLSKGAHSIYANRRHLKLLHDNEYGGLYKKISGYLELFFQECHIPALEQKSLSQWKQYFTNDKNIGYLQIKYYEFFSDLGFNVNKKEINRLRQNYQNLLHDLSILDKDKKFIESKLNNKTAELDSLFNQFHLLFSEHKKLFEDIISFTPIKQFVEGIELNKIYKTTHMHSIRIIYNIGSLLPIYESLKNKTQPNQSLEQEIKLFYTTIRTMSSLWNRLQTINSMLESFYQTYEQLEPNLDYIITCTNQFYKEAKKENNILIENKYFEAIEYTRNKLDFFIEQIRENELLKKDERRIIKRLEKINYKIQ